MEFKEMLPNPLHFDRICRICLSSSDELLSLFNATEDIIHLLVSMSAISISSDDDLPQKICPFCSLQVKTTHYFILKCKESDRKLRLSLQNAVDKSDDDTFPDDAHIFNESPDNVKQAQSKNETTVGEQNEKQSRLRRSKHKKNEIPSETTKSLNCMECEIEYVCSDAFLEHMKIHDKIESAELKELNDIKKNAINMPSKPRNICHICNKSFVKPKNLERHKIVHESIKIKQDLFKCTVCGKQMKHVNHFKMHMRTHRDFNSDSSNHLNSTTENKKQYLCLTCGRACTSRSNLAVHMRRHTGTMTNFCKICGKGYPRSTDLTIHIRKHTGEKPFVCSVCNRGFARSDKLTIHIRTHTGEKPYTCSGCNRSFAQRNDLLSHQRRNVCGSVEKNENESVLQDAI